MPGWFEEASASLPSEGSGFAPIMDPGAYGPTQAGGDPFAYTGGSLLTPWTKPFVAPAGSGGGYSAPSMDPFSYGDFNYGWSGPGGYASTAITGPKAYEAGTIQGPDALNLGQI